MPGVEPDAAAAESTKKSTAGRLKRPAAMVAALVLGLLVVRQTAILESLNFFHPAASSPVLRAGFEEMFIPTPDGRVLHAWWMPPSGVEPGTRAPAVLHCHGNMGDVEDHAPTSDYLPAHGVGVLLFDYRGFGKSTPERMLTRRELLIDARAALAALRRRSDVDPDRIGVFGYSLGGKFALQLAAEDPGIRCVVSVATFSSWPGIAGDVVPVIGPWLIKPGLDAEVNVLAMGSRPVLLIHGQQDQIVGVRHARRIDDAARRAGVLLDLAIVPDKGHFGLFDDEMKRRIGTFVSRHLAIREENAR